jgi:TonB family protein
MALPEFADQKREQERKALKVLLTRTLFASLALHVGLFLLHLKPLWTAAQLEPEEIAIVVTEPEAPEEPDVEEPLQSGEADAEVLTDRDSSSVAEPAPVAAVALPEPIQPELPQPVATAEPVISETPPETVTEPLPKTATATTPTPSPQPTPLTTEQAAATQPQRNLRDLLEQLKRDRATQQNPGSATGTNDSSPTVGAGSSSGDSETGSRTGTGTDGEDGNVATGPVGNPDPPSPTPSTDGSGRRISCRNCPDVNYPEEALRAGQEGTVKVLVDYDENGNVVSATLVDSSGHTVLDQAVLEAVQEKYRLNDSGGAGSTVLSVDMTIDGSEFNRQAEERGDRRTVDIPPPAPIADDPTPANTAAEPIAEPEPLISPFSPSQGSPSQGSPSQGSPSREPTPSAAPTDVPQEAAAPDSSSPVAPEIPGVSETPAEIEDPTLEPAPEPSYEALDTPPAPVEPEPAYAPEPVYTPESVAPEPVYVEPAPADLPPAIEAAPPLEPAPTDALNAE